MNKNDSDNLGRQPDMDSSGREERGGNWRRVLLGGVAIAAVAGGLFAIYSIHHRDYLSSQANSFARTFIRSSPVVQEQLGKVQQVVESKEQHETGKDAGWYLVYKVTGRRAEGVVDLRLTPNAELSGFNVPVQWNVPMAALDVKNKTVNLR